MIRIKRDSTSSAMTIILVIWVIAIAASKGHDFLLERASAAVNEATWQRLVTGRVPVMGTSGASFRIVEFSDYQCPFCALADTALAKFVARHPEDVVVYRYDMPLTHIHRYAYAASIAANCAEMQGVRERYQSLLFLNQKKFSTIDWTELAKQGAIPNSDSFAHCVREQVPKDQILKEMKLSDSLEITATPSFFINGTRLAQGLSSDKLESLYEDMHKDGRGLLHRLFGNPNI